MAPRPATAPEDSRTAHRARVGRIEGLPGEFELIERLLKRVAPCRRAILGAGDDCAILPSSRVPLLFTIDSMVENVHFKLGWCTPEALGARSLTVNLSDIAAMGGKPIACVVNLAVRNGLPLKFFELMYKGLGRAAARARVEVVGGNITRADTLSLTVALLGETRGSTLRRDVARPGDTVYVTGTLGDAAAGLGVLLGHIEARGSARHFLINRFLAPVARIEAGMCLARIKPAPAAIDLSDGLWQDLGHVLDRSRVGAEIDVQKIPLSQAYRAVVGDDPALALGGGDDYELLFCLRSEIPASILTRRLGVPVSRIGRITKSGKRVLVNSPAAAPAAPPLIAGWDQLRSRPSGRR